MSRKRSKYMPKSFESQGEKFIDPVTGKIRADTSANVYQSMLLCAAFQDLTQRQRLLYIVAKSQYYGSRKPEHDFPDIEEYKGETKFYLNWDLVQRYGLYTETMHANFYKDVNALITHGFIKRIVSGAKKREKSVYSFSDEWQKWQK